MSKKFIILLSVFSILSIQMIHASETGSITKALKGGIAWKAGKNYKSLCGVKKASAKVEIVLKNGDKGVIMESGAHVFGLVLYVFKGHIYFQCGTGSKFEANGQSVCKAKITEGTHVIEWSADVAKGKAVLYIDGKLAVSSDKKIKKMLGGSSPGGIGKVFGGIAVTAGKTSGKFTGEIKSCTVWPNK